jgi:hypothetical protein
LELNRNTAFCLSNFIEFVEQSLGEQTILVTLKTIFDDSTAYQPTIGNAAAALCKIMVRFPHTVLLQQALERVLVFFAAIQGYFVGGVGWYYRRSDGRLNTKCV